MFRYLITTIIASVAIVGIYTQYQLYSENPWTRDGQVRAHIIQITPRVTGPVVNVNIDDNSRVKKGDLLFEIEPSLYKAALNNALAKQRQAQAVLAKAINENNRATALEKRKQGSVSVLDLNNFENAVQTAKANLASAEALAEEAQLNVNFTKVFAPTDGFITNLNLREGAQVVANSPVVALIDENSFWIEGFFKETDLQITSPNNKLDFAHSPTVQIVEFLPVNASCAAALANAVIVSIDCVNCVPDLVLGHIISS